MAAEPSLRLLHKEWAVLNEGRGPVLERTGSIMRADTLGSGIGRLDQAGRERETRWARPWPQCDPPLSEARTLVTMALRVPRSRRRCASGRRFHRREQDAVVDVSDIGEANRRRSEAE